MKYSKHIAVVAMFTLCALQATAQQPVASLRGQVLDSTHAAVRGAHITVTGAGGLRRSASAGADGLFLVRGLEAGTYQIAVTAPGFAQSVLSVNVLAGTPTTFHVNLQIAPDTEQVRVSAQGQGVSIDPDKNASAVILKGKALDALSNDPDEMLAELQALAGPAAGPGGAQLYIDGFTGGELPPKSAILEIHVNQNPFSAQYDELGYGRIDVITKPGTTNWHGELGSRGNDAAFNARNPILAGAQPPYHSYDVNGALSGPLSHHASFILTAFSPNHQNTSVVSAIAPGSLTAQNLSGDPFTAAYNSPNARVEITPRLDISAGSRNVLSFRYTYAHNTASNQGIGETTLAPQAYSTGSMVNQFQMSDAILVSSHIADDFRLQYQRVRSAQTPADTAPSAAVQGAFTSGGSSLGAVQDHQNNVELGNVVTISAGLHTLRAGLHARLYNDVNSSTAQQNGAYTFASTTAYVNRQPQLYTVAVIRNPVARITLFDAALFLEDDWKIDPRLSLSYGLRWETQNHIHDTSDWAPRLSLAWAPRFIDPSGEPKTVLRAGYGWFYQRFTVESALGGAFATPYLVTALHENGVNQSLYTVSNPGGYDESSPGIPVKPATPSSTGSSPTIYSVDPRFHAALNMQAAAGIDRQLARGVTANVTYLSSRGIHQYLTNNIGAPVFSTAAQDIYPGTPLPSASANLMQFQSSGVYRETQLIASVHAAVRGVGLSGFYTYSQAHADTTGVTYVPSIAQDPGLDYGRSSFDAHHRLMIQGSATLPWNILFAPMFVFNSGTPYNITTGSDLTGNNQFNARPTFGPAAACAAGAANYVATPWGCLDASPTGKHEKIVPYGLGTGPDNVALNVRLSKTFGIGPRESSTGAPAGGGGAPPPPPGGGLGPGGLSGSGAAGGPPPSADAVARRFNLSFSIDAMNVFNTQNLGSPNGVLSAPSSLRFHSQSLAGGPFSPPEGGNRSIFLETRFSF